MPRPRGVRYDVVRLDLTDGDWIDVKKTLTVGEERDIASLAVRGYGRDGKVDIDAGKLSFLTAAHYLVNWSLLDLQGRAMVWPANLSIAAQEVDVVTTGTFGPMCSSGAYLNFGHSKPRIKTGGGTAFLNGVPAYSGFAAVDFYVGATALTNQDPRNSVFPGVFRYGGGHVIEDLVSGKDVKLVGSTYATDCYPRKEIETWINIKDLNEAVLFNPRNCYQNYNVAVNLSDRVIYTYMGLLQPRLGNANYCSAGQLSPLLNDPYYKTIGIGTRIFLGGGIGYVVWNGTQHNPGVQRTSGGVPRSPTGTLAVMGDLKQMSPAWLKGASFTGYGVTLTVSIGIPIPILNEEIFKYTLVKDEEIVSQVVDCSQSYPQVQPGSLGEVNYKELKSGSITVNRQARAYRQYFQLR